MYNVFNFLFCFIILALKKLELELLTHIIAPYGTIITCTNILKSIFKLNV